MLENQQTVDMSDHDFRIIATLARERFGLSLPDAKRPLVCARLQKRLRSLGMVSLGDYLDYVRSPQGTEETDGFIQSLTTNVTHFFREPHHFSLLKGSIDQTLKSKAIAGDRVRIWSAGCSSGEEPYSIAMALFDTFPDADKYDVKLLATDIDSNMLDRAKTGLYAKQSADKLDERLLRKFMLPQGEEFLVDQRLRDIVRFGQLNLIEPFPFGGPFDVIFCRNVTIYFEKEVQNTVWKKFAKVMDAGSILVIGHSERLSSESAPLFENIGTTAYQRTSEEIGSD